MSLLGKIGGALKGAAKVATAPAKAAVKVATAPARTVLNHLPGGPSGSPGAPGMGSMVGSFPSVPGVGSMTPGGGFLGHLSGYMNAGGGAPQPGMPQPMQQAPHMGGAGVGMVQANPGGPGQLGYSAVHDPQGNPVGGAAGGMPQGAPPLGGMGGIAGILKARLQNAPAAPDPSSLLQSQYPGLGGE